METESSDGYLDFTAMQMSPEKFNGTNYIYWSRCVETFLKALRLAEHLTSDEPAAASDDGIWEQKDAQVMCMMMNSVESNIRSTLVYLPTAKKMWLRLRHMYWGNGDLFHKYAVCKRFFRLKQGNNESVDEYFSRAMILFYEFDLLFPTSSDASVMQKRWDDIVVFKFLEGLSDEYEPTINQILQGTELPSLHQVCNICVQVEEAMSLTADRGSNSFDNNTAQGRGGGRRGGRGGRGNRNRW